MESVKSQEKMKKQFNAITFFLLVILGFGLGLWVAPKLFFKNNQSQVLKSPLIFPFKLEDILAKEYIYLLNDSLNQEIAMYEANLKICCGENMLDENIIELYYLSDTLFYISQGCCMSGFEDNLPSGFGKDYKGHLIAVYEPNKRMSKLPTQLKTFLKSVLYDNLNPQKPVISFHPLPAKIQILKLREVHSITNFKTDVEKIIREIPVYKEFQEIFKKHFL
jgi:hypothetical protein